METKVIDIYEDMDGDELNFIEEYDDNTLKSQQGVIMHSKIHDSLDSKTINVCQKKRRIEDLIKDKFPIADGQNFSTSLSENIKQVSDYVLSVLDKNEEGRRKSRKRKASSPARALTCVKQAGRKKVLAKTSNSTAISNTKKNITIAPAEMSKLIVSNLKGNSLAIKDIRPFVPISITPQRPFTSQIVTNGSTVYKPVFRYRLPVCQTLMLRPNCSASTTFTDNSQLQIFKQTVNVSSPSFLFQSNQLDNKLKTVPPNSMMFFLKNKNLEDISVKDTKSLRIINGQPDYAATKKCSDNPVAYRSNVLSKNIQNIQIQQKPSTILLSMDSKSSTSNKQINLHSSANPQIFLPNSLADDKLKIENPKENNCDAFDKLFSILDIDIIIPDIPDNLYLNDLKFFKCRACNVKFTSEEDIQLHLQRNSTVLKFRCICDDQRNFLTFTNPCTFKIYHKTHVSTKKLLKHSTLKNVIINPIDYSSHLTFKFSEQIKELENLKEQTKQLIEQKDLVNISDEEIVIDVINEDSLINDKNHIEYNVNDDVPCSVCSLKFNIFDSSYEKHFHNNEFSSSFQCKMCFRYLPSKCSYTAHINIHNLSKPYICPECGLLFNKSRASFMNHVKNTCFHYTRFTTVKCKLCFEVVNFANYIKQHIIEKHSNIYYKCNSCNKAFILPTGFTKHNIKEHDNLAKSEEVSACPFCKIVISKQIIANHIASKHEGNELHEEMNNYRCCICEMHFVHNHEMLEHIHLKHSNIFPMELMCLICNKPQMTLHSLLKHYASCHDVISKISDGSILIPLKKGPANKKKITKQNVLNSNTSSSNANLNKSVQGVNLECKVELTNCSPKPTQMFCKQCQANFSNKETFERHVKRHKFLKNKSKKKVYHPHAKELKRMKNTKRRKKIYNWANCHLCAKMFKNHDQLKNHMLQDHHEKVTNRNFSCFICKGDVKSFASLATLSRHLKIGHKLTKEKIEALKNQSLKDNFPPSSHKDIDSEKSAKSLKLFNGVGNFVCFWCHFETDNRDIFTQHIGEHNERDTCHYQCTECGVTYPILSSLHHHLFAIHAVTDFKAYEAAINLKLEEEVEESENDEAETKKSAQPQIDEKPLQNVDKKILKSVKTDEVESEFECNVCYKTFDNRNTLRMHMRVHGMAFIEGTKRNMMMASNLHINT